MCMCVHAFYLLMHSAEWHTGATLGRVGLSAASPLSLPGQMAPVTESGGEAMEGKGERGSSEPPLTAPEWPVPRATTSGDHLQLVHPASSVRVPFPLAHAHFLTGFFQMGEVGLVAVVYMVRL